MAFPVIEGTPTEGAVTTAGTNHAITLPASIQSGELLLVVLGYAFTGRTFSVLAGWTELVDDNSANGVAMWWRIATGGDANPTFVSNSTTKSTWFAFRISGHDAATPPTLGTVGTGTSAAPDPGNCNPGVTKDFLWFTYFNQGGEEVDDDTWCNNAATNYSNLLQKATGTASTAASNCQAAICSRTNNASSEDAVWPAATTDQSLLWRAYTIAIHPSAASALPIPDVIMAPSEPKSGYRR